MKKVLSLLLVTLLLVAAVPAFATGTDAEASADYKFITLFDDDDVTSKKMINVFNSWNKKEDDRRASASSTYTRLSDYSAQMGPLGTGACQYFNICTFGEEGVDRTGYDYINYVVYADTPISVTSNLVDASGDYGLFNDSTSNSSYLSFNQGWNVVTVAMNRTTNPTDKIDYAFGDNTTIKEITFGCANGYTIPSVCVNGGEKLNAQTGLTNAKIYVDAIFLSKSAPTAPAISGTSIANGATGISRNLDKYVVTFDSAMNAKSFTAETLTVKETATDAPVTVKSVTANGDKATIAFDAGTLAAGTQYTVTVSGDVNNAYGVSLGADAAYTFTTSPYAVTGIYANENVLMNIGGARNRVRTVGINTTENVAKVVYMLDGVEAATKTVAPFTWDMPLDAVASHSLSAVVYDAADAAYEADGVNFKVMYESPVAYKESGFEGTVGEAIPTGSPNLFTYYQSDRGTITYAEDPAGVKEGTVLKAVKTYAENKDFAFGLNVPIDASRIVQIDVDIYVTNPSDVRMRIDKHSVYGETDTCIAVYDLYNNNDKPAFKSGANWNHVTVLMDFKAPRYEIYINGAFHRSAVLHENYLTPANFGLVFAGKSSYYLDDLKIQTIDELTASDAMLDAATFTATEDGWDADVTIANFANIAKEYTVLTAVYDASGNVIAVDKQVVNAPADEISTAEYTVAKTRGDKTGAKVRAFVWESVEGVLTLRPIAEIN